MTGVTSKRLAGRVTWPALALVIAAGCGIAATNWLSITNSYIKGEGWSSQRAALMWQMWAVLALAFLSVSLIGFLWQRLTSLSR
jgi:TRAP-type mannitol/chloroaromatic compound transport system permease small subunit